MRRRRAAFVLRKIERRSLMASRISTAQDLVSVEDVADGFIKTPGRGLVRILEISPVNLMMKSAEEQEALFSAYRAWTRSSPSSYTIKCTMHPAPVGEYQRAILGNLQKEKDEGAKRMIEDHLMFSRSLGAAQSLESRNYLIYSYSQDDDYLRSRTEEDRMRFMMIQEAAMTQEFSAMGNDVIEKDDEDLFLCDFLYSYYNRGIAKKVPFTERLKRVLDDGAKAEKGLGVRLNKACMKDVLCPISFNDSESRDYVIVDGLYCSYYAVDRDGYPQTLSAPSGWLSGLVNFGFGYEVDLHFEKKDPVEMLAKMRSQRRFTRLKLNDRGGNAEDVEEIADSLTAIEELRIAVKEQGEEIYDMSILIGVYAYTKEDLYARIRALERFAKKNEITLQSFWARQLEGFLSMAPLNSLTPKAKEVSSHNVPTRVVAASYPYSSFSISDEGGMLIGTHQYNDSLVIFNPFLTSRYSNANMIILGEPGRGKTFSLLTIASRLRYQGVQVFIIAPEKQDEFRRVTEALGGAFVDISASSNARINPLDIRPVESEADSRINRKKGNETSWLTDKIETLSLWTQYLLQESPREEKARIKACFMRAYAKYGITQDNESLYEDAERRMLKDMPALSDFAVELEKEDRVSEDTKAVFRQFTEEDGPYRSLSGRTNIDLGNKFTVFGLERLGRDLKPAAMFSLLDYIWSAARSDKTKRKAVIIDEGSLLVDGRLKQAGEFVVDIFRLIRGYGGSAVFATQSITDLYKNNGEFGNAILSCAHSKLLLGMNTTDLRFVSKELELTKQEEAAIREFSRKGQAMLCAGKSHIPVYIKASKEEFDLFTTDRAELERIAERSANE